MHGVEREQQGATQTGLGYLMCEDGELYVPDS